MKKIALGIAAIIGGITITCLSYAQTEKYTVPPAIQEKTPEQLAVDKSIADYLTNNVISHMQDATEDEKQAIKSAIAEKVRIMPPVEKAKVEARMIADLKRNSSQENDLNQAPIQANIPSEIGSDDISNTTNTITIPINPSSYAEFQKFLHENEEQLTPQQREEMERWGRMLKAQEDMSNKYSPPAISKEEQTTPLPTVDKIEGSKSP